MKSTSETHALTIRSRVAPRPKIRELNDVLICYICKGYMIDPTTVDNCWHTYCRSCIVLYLQSSPFCPQCKATVGKHGTVSRSNLKSDDVLRAVIYKLVPGLYQSEREHISQFAAELHHNGQCQPVADKELDLEDDLFSPTEPISLSLEYHPSLLQHCRSGDIPVVRYLQCPAGVKIHHLKRLLCAKYGIELGNKDVKVDIIYEDEVLPNDFSLMDVGYCYKWQRHSPMKFTYSILFFENDGNAGGSSGCESGEKLKNGLRSKNHKELYADNASNLKHKNPVSFSDNNNTLLLISRESSNQKTQKTIMATTAKAKSNLKKHDIPDGQESSNSSASNVGNTVKMVIARKCNDSKKVSLKRSSNDELGYAKANDFKSLRSNDLRYSDYAVTSTTKCTGIAQSSSNDAEGSVGSDKSVTKCEIVVSIPHSQMPKSPHSLNEQFDNVSFVHLKTASKKSPNSSVTSEDSAKSSRNVPKLKIELNSLKTKLAIPKPKSADSYLEECGESKSLKHRKYSQDESRHIADKVDLQTYAKTIGLQPIEVLPFTEQNEKLKLSPNASPLSSSSSSSTSSSSSSLPKISCADIVSSSFHKKRRKKHSKDIKDAKDMNGKRKRLHAEISSQLEEESLKMKVKITAPYNHRAHRTDQKKGPLEGINVGEESLATCGSNGNEKSIDTSKPNHIASKSGMKNENLEAALNKTLCEESKSITKLMNFNEETKEEITTAKPPLLSKPLSNVKDAKIPSSPPLPPSLFKTTALAFKPLSVATTTENQSNSSSMLLKQPELEKEQPSVKKCVTKSPANASTSFPVASTTTPALKSNMCAGEKQMGTQKGPQFVVPTLPRRIPSSSSGLPKFFGTPSSIASATNKQIGMHLKRSASLDDSYTAKILKKHQLLDNDGLVRKNVFRSGVSGGAQIGTSIKCHTSTGALQKQEKPFSSASITSTAAFDVPFYGPSAAGKFAIENSKRSRKIPLPTSTISICELSEDADSIEAASSANTLPVPNRPRATTSSTPWTPLSYSPPHTPYRKPALEIVRITSNQIPVDLQPLPPIIPPRVHGLMGPPEAMVRGKKTSGHQFMPLSSASISSNVVRSPPLTVNSPSIGQERSQGLYRSSPPALINLRSTYSSKQCSNADSRPKIGESSKNSSLGEKVKSSLREFRPAVKESVDTSDLTTSADAKYSNDGAMPGISGSLEAALNKIKQNITSSTVVDSMTAKKLKVAADGRHTDDLQNLHLLSESATAREKITIRSTSQLYEKTKSLQASLARHQNASVRNIPNPSALAFRDITTLSPLTNDCPTTMTTTECNNSSSFSAPHKKNTSALYQLGSQKETTLTPIVTMSSSTSRPIKKPTTIDQVAANLNLRAVAAEAQAKTNSTDDTIQITSSTIKTNDIELSSASIVTNNPSDSPELSPKTCDSSTSSPKTAEQKTNAHHCDAGKPKEVTTMIPVSPDSATNNNNNDVASSSNNTAT